MDFYKGRVLRIDLSAGTSTVEPLNMEWAQRYLGGKGLLLRYLWEEVPPGVDPWAAENPVILMSGPTAGTGVFLGSRLVVGCKSPVTGILTDSYVGGSFAPEMKFAGYDAIIVTGESPKPVVVTVRDDVVSFVPAEDKYWGMRTSEIEEAMRRDFDPEAKTLSIGPAGENEVAFACLSTDLHHKAGRGGHGALVGRKKLKAIAIRGTGSVSVGDANEFLDYVYRLQTDHVLNEDNLAMHEEGTPGGAQVYSDAGAIPTRNFSSGTFAGMENINSDALLAIRTKVRACYQCPIGCRQWHEAGGVSSEGPEYETIALCGSNCGVSDIEALMRFNQACNEWGVDTISLGNVVALAMDLTEKGVEDFGLRFGETDSYVKAPALTAKREGIGAELSLGTRALAAKYGHPELGFEVKSLELPGFDPRGSFGMSLAYATADRGGCHMRAFPAGDELELGTRPPDSLEGKAPYVIDLQNEGAAKWSAGLCDFWQVDVEQLCLLCERICGRSVSEDEFLRLGERVWNLGRLFNLREGVEKDDLPALMRAEEGAFADGVSAGKVIGERAFAAALQEYYTLRGWDEHGVPSEAKLTELGIDVRL